MKQFLFAGEEPAPSDWVYVIVVGLVMAGAVFIGLRGLINL